MKPTTRRSREDPVHSGGGEEVIDLSNKPGKGLATDFDVAFKIAESKGKPGEGVVRALVVGRLVPSCRVEAVAKKSGKGLDILL